MIDPILIFQDTLARHLIVNKKNLLVYFKQLILQINDASAS